MCARRCDALSTEEYRDDVLILAGDVSDDLPTLRQTLQVLKARFAHVFFTPGEVVRVCRMLGASPAIDPLQVFQQVLVWTDRTCQCCRQS
jgi:hypothetical protein